MKPRHNFHRVGLHHVGLDPIDLNLLRLLLAAILLLVAAPDSRFARAAEPPAVLRVLSFNIHHGEGVDGKLDLKRIAQVIQSAKPDIVALQELDRNTRRTGNVDQPAELARLSDMQVVFGGNIAFEGGNYGNAILSRFPISEVKNHPLKSYDDGEQRGVLSAEIAIAEGRSVRLLATHLDHRQDDRERIESAKAIRHLTADHDQPMLLAVLELLAPSE